MIAPAGARVVVIGAGPAGLAAAYELAKREVPVHVLEAAPHVGGLARSFELWGQIVDIGPHRFFSEVPEVNALFREIVGDDYRWITRLTRIHFRGGLIRYPLHAGDVLKSLGAVEIARSTTSYASARLSRGPVPTTFEEWVTRRFGQRLFELFFKSYSEKVWGIPCSRIDAAWAAQRILALSFFEAAKSALLGNARKHRTLADAFPYPTSGTGSIYVRMAERVRAMGGTVDLGTPVERVMLSEDGARVTGVRDGSDREIPATHVVSTMPITALARGLPGAPRAVIEACDALRYRNTIFVYLEMDDAHVFPDNWIYVHAPELRHGRITNFRNFGRSLSRGRPTSILCLELWCFDDDAIWRASDDEIAALAERELSETGLAKGVSCLRSHVLRVRRSYPVYEVGYRRHLAVIERYLGSIEGLFAAGRYGAFKYNNQDHSLHMGLLAARAIATGRPEALSEINTDPAYQESARIDDTGLSR